MQQQDQLRQEEKPRGEILQVHWVNVSPLTVRRRGSLVQSSGHYQALGRLCLLLILLPTPAQEAFVCLFPNF